MKGLSTHSLITQQLPLASIEKEPGCNVGEAKRMRRGRKNYSMIYTSKPLEGYGHHVEYFGGIYWCGVVKGRSAITTRRVGCAFKLRLPVVVLSLFLFSATALLL